jgi:kexin
MTRASLAIVILSCSVFAKLEPRSHNTHEFFALQLDGFTHPDHIATALGAQYAGPIGGLPDHHAFSLPKRGDNGIDALLRAQRNKEPQLESSADALDSILWSTTIPAAEHSFYKREPPMENAFESILTGQPDVDAVHAQNNIARSLGIDDPLFPQQWHLFNTVQVGNDLNVTGVWLEGIAGENVTTAIVDDGLDMDSLDLRPNYYASGSYDFNDLVPEPKPRLEDDHHGTRCAGEVAAAKNDVCGIGVAYNSRVSGIRMLSGKVDDIDQAAAINYDYQHNDIYSCSWGPPDDGMHMKAPGLLVQRAIVNGVQNGRGGKGSIFVFSAGNGASQDDNCNFDGYTNSIYSVTVGAIDRMGKHPLYSESCSALLVSAFSSGSGEGIYTTDNGPNECSSLHSGTSAAGPLAAGVIALALSARPDLTWRDIQYLLVETSVPVHELDGSWQPTKSGRIFSHDWGYGKVDAYSLVQKAKTWDLVKPQAWFHSPWLEVCSFLNSSKKKKKNRKSLTLGVAGAV